MSIRRSSLLAAFAVASLLLAVACGDDGGDASGGGAEGADDQRTVVLLTYDSFALPEEAAERFEELTGARIEVRATGDAGSMLTGALLAAGAPEGDVIFGIDNTLATRVLQEDLLEPFTPDGIDAIPQRYLLEGELGRLLTPVDAGDVCVNVDEAWFEDEGIEPPSTMEDLASEPYRDLLVVESPVTSSPGLAFLLTTIDRYGEDGWQDYWKRLADNGVRVRPSWDDAYYNDYTVSGGDRPLVLSYASSPPAEVVFGDLDEPRSSVMTDSCGAQVEYAGVLRGAEEPELARELVEFMVSETWQEALPLANFVFPVREDVRLPEEFERWAERADDPAGLPPELVEERRDTWIEQWRELME
ncbi:MAG TPA: thiamine ABC transporter substrate-binding protein [Microthrixaceae bacterium]|nr:thiamine ABC transporter substrate-binding protein [Microthrixaceae bacterium]